MSNNSNKTPLDKTHSTVQKTINRLRKKIITYQTALENRRKELKSYYHLIDVLLADGRLTKDELTIYIKRKNRK